MKTLQERFPIYSRLLRLYPAAYYQEYHEQMLQTLADMLDDPQQSKALAWLHTAVDFPLSFAHQQLITAGGIMKNEMPQYMKRNAIIGVAMLLPFFAFIALNSLMSPDLPNSPAWNFFFLTLILGLPIVAFVLNFVTFFRWTSERRTAKASFWKSLFDFRHNWPVLIVAGLSLLIAIFIPFHDSTHCVTGNPIRELHNPSQTWQCITRG